MKDASHPLRQVVYLRDLLRELVLRDILLRYKRSVLGIAWSLLNPLLQLLVFYFVFRYIIPVPVKGFAVFLFIGILVWNWFSSSLNFGCGAITDNVSLIRQPGFPSAILPVVTVSANLVNFLLAVPILLIAVVLTGKELTSALIALPLVIAVQFLLTLSIVYVLAALHVFFRDTQYLIGVLLLLGFYLSPVFYESSSIPPIVRPFYRLNPIVHILDAYRSIFMQGRISNGIELFLVAVGSAVVLTLAYLAFVRTSHWFVEEIGS